MDLRGLMVAIKTSPCCTGCFCSISGLEESKSERKQEATHHGQGFKVQLIQGWKYRHKGKNIAKVNRIEATAACRGSVTLSSTWGQTCRWANRKSMRTQWGSREGIVIGTI